MKKKSLMLAISIIVLICLFIILTPGLSSINKMNHLKSNGWSVESGGRDEIKIMTNEFINEEITNMKTTEAKKVGYNPESYMNNSIKIYTYVLYEKGISNKLRAEIWVYNNKIILSTLYHVENNLKIMYWPINTSYKDILNDLSSINENQ